MILKKLFLISIILSSVLSFSQKTKAITEFRNEHDSIIKVRKSLFNKNGRLVEEIRFGGYDSISKTYRNRIRKITYDKNRKILETNCELFINQDTCITLPFAKYSYDRKAKIEKRIFYDSDSLIISITEEKELKRKKYITIYAWDFDPVKKPNYSTAFVMQDTLILDKKGRVLESVSYRKNSEKPVIIEKYNYNKNGYTLHKEIYGRKSIIVIKYSKLQIWGNKRNLEYDFSNDESYYYEFENY